MKIFKDISTGNDGESYDIVRVAMASLIFLQEGALIIGLSVYIGGYLYSIWHPKTKLFDIQTFFTATATFSAGIVSLLIGGASALFIKRKTESDTPNITTGNPQ